MKKTVLIVLLYFIGCLLIPCLVTLAIGDDKKVSEKASAVKTGEATEVEETEETEDYIIRTVASYYEDGDGGEFLKALAIVVRTYDIIGEDLDFTPMTLTYQELKTKWGDYYSANLEAVTAAVNATEGIVMELESGDLLPYFCQISAGYTRGMENSCLAMVNCSEDLNAPDYMTVVSYTHSEVVNKFEEEFPDLTLDGGIADCFQVISRDEAGYVTEVMVGNITLSGDELAKVLSLNSGNFMVTPGDENMVFTVKGIGSGYGMSLYTARQKAVSGAGYKEILFYFYKNISLNE